MSVKTDSTLHMGSSGLHQEPLVRNVHRYHVTILKQKGPCILLRKGTKNSKIQKIQRAAAPGSRGEFRSLPGTVWVAQDKIIWDLR